MTYLYIDESGDLGFSEKSSNLFILACAKIKDDKTNILFNRIPKEVRQRTISKKLKKVYELKFSNSRKMTREMFLKRVSKLDISIYALIIDKKEVHPKLRNDLPLLYNLSLKHLLGLCLTNLDSSDKAYIFIDRSMSKTQIKVFEEFIRCELIKPNCLSDPIILHENSKINLGLQVIDFICGSFRYKYCSQETECPSAYYVDLIKDNIKFEKMIIIHKEI